MPSVKFVCRNSTAAGSNGFKEDLSKGATFRFQDSLPRLPVPTLEETAVRYLRSIKPLALPDTYLRTEAAVKEFIRPGGEGEILQKRLQQRAADPKIKNWLYEFWNESAYMAYRDPVVPYVSYFYSYKDDPQFLTPAKRAAAIVTGALKFKKQLDTRTLEPDYMRKAPIDMELFRYLFHNCRIPRPGCDENVEHSPRGNEYFIVLRRNRFYRVPYQTPDGRQLSTAEIEHQFLRIYEDADLKGTGPNIGALTSENRDVWVSMYERLSSASPKNREILKQIEAAAFVVCLDFASPSTDVERTMQYWHGYCQNRFYDKPIQFIINDNNTAGHMGEHSMMDGTQTFRLNDFICDQLFNHKLELTTQTEFDAPVQELAFDVNDQIQADINRALADFNAEIDKHEVAVWIYKGYGKDMIKQFKCSPDAFLQMLLQLAYYKLNHKLRPVYESAATRKFAQGRTETSRSVSIESRAFVEAFYDPSVTPKEKIAKFRAAIAQQSKYTAEAGEGRGVDRHLFGLRRMLQPGEPMPQIFKDPLYAYSCTWYISSSQLSSEYFNGYGWSQVVDDGFGTAYMINKNTLQVNICSKKKGSYHFRDALEQSANELGKLLSTELNVAKL